MAGTLTERILASSSPITDEKDLLIKLRDGDEAAFTSIYHQYKIPLGYRILRMVKSEELTEELLQDLFMKLWMNRASIQIDRSLKAYLYQTAKNLVIDLLRRAAKEKDIHELIMQTTTEAYAHIEERIFQKENEKYLLEAIDQLPPQRKKIFTLCKLEGKSYREVAELHHISTSTVNDHVQKATHFIRDYLTSIPGFQLALLLSTFFF